MKFVGGLFTGLHCALSPCDMLVKWTGRAFVALQCPVVIEHMRAVQHWCSCSLTGDWKTWCRANQKIKTRLPLILIVWQCRWRQYWATISNSDTQGWDQLLIFYAFWGCLKSIFGLGVLHRPICGKCWAPVSFLSALLRVGFWKPLLKTSVVACLFEVVAF